MPASCCARRRRPTMLATTSSATEPTAACSSSMRARSAPARAAPPGRASWPGTARCGQSSSRAKGRIPTRGPPSARRTGYCSRTRATRSPSSPPHDVCRRAADPRAVAWDRLPDGRAERGTRRCHDAPALQAGGQGCRSPDGRPFAEGVTIVHSAGAERIVVRLRSLLAKDPETLARVGEWAATASGIAGTQRAACRGGREGQVLG